MTIYMINENNYNHHRNKIDREKERELDNEQINKQPPNYNLNFLSML